MRAIYKKELQSYFTSMIGCVFIAFSVGIISLYFFAVNLFGGYPYLGYSLSSTVVLFMILIPILTMKSVADDRRQKTDQMLLTAPVSTWQIMISKYLAMITVFMIPVGLLLLYPLILAGFGSTSMVMSYTAIMGFALMGFLAIAAGLFISSVTESQVIAAVLTFLLLFVSYMAEAIAQLMPANALGDVIGTILGALCLTKPFYNFASGLIDIPGIIFYLSGSFLFLFLSVQAVEKRRWC